MRVNRPIKLRPARAPVLTVDRSDSLDHSERFWNWRYAIKPEAIWCRQHRPECDDFIVVAKVCW